MNPTLLQLHDFFLENEIDLDIDIDKSIIQTYLNDSKSSWSKGKYYLGGQIKLDQNEPITPELITKAWKPYLDGSCDYYCNSFEYASILRSKAGLTSIEKIVNKYIEIQKMRSPIGGFASPSTMKFFCWTTGNLFI